MDAVTAPMLVGRDVRGATLGLAGFGRIGKAVAKDEESYRYLIESIERFPDMPAFKAMVAAAGFRNVKAEPVLGGLVAIHSGWKV